MDVGLHIGLASWIHAQGDESGFVAWPGLPTPLALGELEVVGTMHDVVRAWEFAHLTNGEVHEDHLLVSGASPLWSRHRALLSAMEFAARPWTADEDGVLRDALAVLFEPSDFPAPTSEYLLYQEYRQAHRDLEASSADPADIAAVLALWVAQGHKVVIEAAQTTISRLTQRSSRPVAEQQRAMLHPDLLLSTPTGSYAPTTMTPLAATDESTWLHGQASFDELDRAVGDGAPRSAWDSWRANRRGTVLFRFIALTLHRSWFEANLYERRDWRLQPGAIASAGDGVEGALPAYADRVYLARVEDVRIQGGSGTRPGTATAEALLVHAKPRLDALRPAKLHRIPALVARSKALGMGPADTARSVSRAQVVRPALASAASSRPGSKVMTTIGPVTRQHVMRPAVLGYMEPLSLVRLHTRFALAEALIARRPSTSVPESQPVTTPAYFVGLGCRRIPASPNPNDSYEWAA